MTARHRSLKRALFIDHYEKWARQDTAEKIARAILDDVSGPGETCDDPACPDRIRYLRGLADAAIARRFRGTP